MMLLLCSAASTAMNPSPDVRRPGDDRHSIPAFTAMIIGTTGLMSITITMATYRENGILRRLRTTPVSPLVVLAAQVIVVFVMTCLGMLLLIIAGKLVYHVRFEGNAFSVLARFHPEQPELLRHRIHPGGHHAHGAHRPDRRRWCCSTRCCSSPAPLSRGAAARSRPEGLRVPAADLRGQPAARPVDRRGLERTLLDAGVLAAMLVVGVLISIKTFRWE